MNYLPTERSAQLLVEQAMVDTTLTLALSPTSVEGGDSVTARGVLTTIGGNPIIGERVYLLDQNGENVRSAVTGISGIYVTTSFEAPSDEGSYVYTAVFNGTADYNPSSASDSLTVIVLDVPTTISLAFSPSVAKTGDLVNAYGNLSQVTGAIIMGQTVTLEDAGGGIVGSAITDISGSYNIQFNAPSTPGTYTYIASFAGGIGYIASYASSTIKALGEIPIGNVVLVAIPVAAVIVGSLLYKLSKM